MRNTHKGALMGELLNLKEKLGPKKVQVSISIDKELYDKIIALKEEAQIKEFSPVINELLRDYFKIRKRGGGE